MKRSKVKVTAEFSGKGIPIWFMIDDHLVLIYSLVFDLLQ